MLEIIKENICEGLQCNLSQLPDHQILHQNFSKLDLYIEERGFVIQTWNNKLRFNCVQYTGKINNWKGKYISKILPYKKEDNNSNNYSAIKITNNNPHRAHTHRNLIIKENNKIILQLHFINYNKLNKFLSWLMVNSNWNVIISQERSEVFGNNI